MLLIFLQYLFLIQGITALDVGDDCAPNTEISEGVCTIFSKCEVAIRLLRNKVFHSFERCGFNGLEEVVCCPRSTTKFGSTTEKQRLTQRIADRECEKMALSRISPLDLHIIGGESSALGEFPHMAALGFDRGNGYEFDCGGSLLSNTYVLTAAHCIDTLDRIGPSIVRLGVVELGDNSWNDETDVRIAEIKTHPKYTRREKYHDLALVRLQRPVQYSSILIAACLYTDPSDPRVPLTVTGWGTISTTKDVRSSILLKANVTVVSRSKCDESYRNWRKLPRNITEEQLCAGDPDGLRDTCQGDSGGPLQVMTSSESLYRIVGVTSFGRGCGSPVPGVYTRIYHYLDWIESIVWKS